MIGAAAAVLSGSRAWALAPDRTAFATIEAKVGGRLGVMVLDTASGRTFAHRAEERFPMCSTFKWVAVAAVLARVDKGAERLERLVAYSKADLLPTSPTTSAHVDEGALPMETLCRAAVTQSDNCAANLILASLGGPEGLTRWLRGTGDTITRLDQRELELNNPGPFDPRNRTSPAQTVANLNRFLLRDGVLSAASRERLTGWMVANRTGDTRLRAGVPSGWKVADKTGAWGGTTVNDLGLIWPPGRPPVLIAAYSTRGPAKDETRNAALADVAKAALSSLGLAA